MVAPNLLKWASRFDSASKKYHWDTIKKPNYENRKPQVVSPLVSSAVQENQNKPWEHTELHFMRPTVLKRSDCWPYMAHNITLLFRASLYQYPVILSLTLRNSSHFSGFGNLALQLNLPPVLLIDSKEELLQTSILGELELIMWGEGGLGALKSPWCPWGVTAKGLHCSHAWLPTQAWYPTSICPSPPWPLVHTSHLPVKKSAEGKGSGGRTHRGFHTGDLKSL